MKKKTNHSNKLCFIIFYIKKRWIIILTIIVAFVFSIWCIFFNCHFQKFWFDAIGKTKSEILAFIGAIVGSIILWGNLVQNTRRNNLIQKSNIDIRFKDAATLFCSQDVSSILSGVFALHQVAIDSKNLYQDKYVNIVKDIYCIRMKENRDDYLIRKIVIERLVERNVYPKKQLQGVDFSDMVLIGADFTGADLSGAKFHGTDLSNADFTGAILSDADFSIELDILSPIKETKTSTEKTQVVANLTDAIMHRAYLSGVIGLESVKGYDTIIGLDTAIGYIKQYVISNEEIANGCQQVWSVLPE